MRAHLALASLIVIAIAVGGLFLVALWEMRRQAALGQLHFPISCNAGSQRLFDFATARLHSLSFNEAERAYTAIAEAEPDCAMAYWGIAMSRIGRPVAGSRASDDLDAGRAALRSAAHAATASPRERAYIDALGRLFESDDARWIDHAVGYEQAMETLARSYPEDKEAVIFYALALNIAALPSDPTFQNQTKAAELLLRALGEQPRHPGLSHYLTYCLSLPRPQLADAPSLAEYRALSEVQSGLAILALAGVLGFFLAMVPAWSRGRRVGDSSCSQSAR
jgi:hypothetical protein